MIPRSFRFGSCLQQATGAAAIALVSLTLGCTGTVGGGLASNPDAPNGQGGSSGSNNGGAPPRTGEDPPPPGPGDLPDPESCTPGQDGLVTTRLWRLNARQYGKTVAALLGERSQDANRDLVVPSDVTLPFGTANNVDRFSTRARSYSMSDSDLADALTAADEVSTRLGSLLQNHPCVTASGTDCAKPLIADKGAILFRRPLTDAERGTYEKMFADFAPTLGRGPALQHVFRTMLMAPQFLFRTELGTGTDDQVKLTSHELASAISYGLTDGPPDQELWDLAEQGNLQDPDVLKDQVIRLATASLENGPLAEFVREYFGYSDVLQVDKNQDSYPSHDRSLLLDDTERLVSHLLKNKATDGLLSALLTTREAVVRKDTAWSYGKSETLGTEPSVVTFGGDERMGLLTQPAWLVARSTFDENDPIRRGRFIRESLLCGEIPDVMIEEFPAIEHTEDQTLREELAAHSSKPNCRFCHQLMDPLGLVFEGYDHVGRPRATEAGRPVDTSGEIVAVDDASLEGPVEGPAQLLEKLASSSFVTGCFVRHAFTYWMGREATEADACTLSRARAAYQSGGGNALEMIATFFTAETFLTRRTQ